MNTLSLTRNLPRAIRLQSWVAGSLVLFWLAPLLFESIADKDSAYGIRVDSALQGPSTADWFGTDASGRSQWNRTLIASAISLRVVGGSLLVALPLSLLVGSVAGANEQRWPDRIILWFIALLQTVPFFLLVVAVAALIGPGTSYLPWLIGGIIWAPAARLVRSETIRIMKGRFVVAGRAAGQSSAHIFIRSVFPLVTPPATVSLFYLVPEIIGVDAILTLFGLGPQPPTPSLGSLIFDGVRRWNAAPWLAGWPCVLLIAICLGVYFLADRIAAQLRTSP